MPGGDGASTLWMRPEKTFEFNLLTLKEKKVKLPQKNLILYLQE